MKKQIIPTLIAGTFLGAVAALPIAHAGEAKNTAEPTLEQRSEQFQGAVKDAWLDGSLETALLFNGHLNPFEIDTEVKNGVVHLSGVVESDIDRDLAGEIARSIDGVKDVENELTVDREKATASRERNEGRDEQGFKQTVTNATLTARIKSELLVNTNTSGLAIDVDTHNDEVTLSGKVNSEQEKELAGQIASNAAGTRSVKNELTVDNES